MSVGSLVAVLLAVIMTASFLGAWVKAPRVVVAVGIAAIFAGLCVWVARCRSGKSAPYHAPVPSARTRMIRALFMLLCGMALVQFVRLAGIPLVNYDVLGYHVSIAQGFLAEQSAFALLHDPQSFYARLPLGASILEGLFTGANPYGCGIQFFIIFCVIAGAQSAATVTALLGGRTVARWLAAILYLFHPLIVNNVMQGLVDPLTTLFAIAGAEMLLRMFSRSGCAWHGAVAGFLVGASFATKYSAAGIVIIPLLIAAVLASWSQWKRHGAARSLRRLAVFVVGIALAAGPWLLRAYAVGGSLAHPFRGETPSWTAQQARFVVDAHGRTSPLSFDYWSAAVSKTKTFGYEIPFVGVSALVVCAALMLFSRHRSRGLPLVIAAGLGYAAWLLMRDNPARFLLPAVAFLVPVAAIGATQSLRNRIAARVVCAALLVCVCWANVGSAKVAMQVDGVYTAPARCEVLGGYLGEGYQSIVNSALAENDEGRILLVFEAREALFNGRADANAVWDQPRHVAALKKARSAAEFANSLRRADVSGIFVNEFEWGRLLDFYAKEQLPPGDKHMGRIGMTAKLGEGEFLKCLAAYPPHRFAGLNRRELKILRDFLLTCRRNASAVSPAGPGAEIWCAQIPDESEFK